MTNWDYPFSFPTSGWKGQLTIPRELSLRTTSEGIRLHQSPISELETLRNTVIHVNNREVTETSQNVLKGLQAGAFEIEAEVEFLRTARAGIRLPAREGGGQQTVVGYNNSAHHMFIDRSASGTTDFSSLFSTEHKALLYPIDGVVKRVFTSMNLPSRCSAMTETLYSRTLFFRIGPDGVELLHPRRPSEAEIPSGA